MNRSKVAVAASAMIAAGATAAATAWPASTAGAAGRTVTVYSFGVNSDRANLIAAPGTKPSKPAAGDYTVVNDKITDTTRQACGCYAVIGKDSGMCMYTRVYQNGNSFADCVDTIVIRGSSLLVQGVLVAKGGVPQDGTAAVIGGTGNYEGATGTIHVHFGKEHNTYTFSLS